MKCEFEIDDDMVAVMYPHTLPDLKPGEVREDPPVEVMREAAKRLLNDRLCELLFCLTHNDIKIQFKRMAKKNQWDKDKLDMLTRVGQKVGVGWQKMDIGFKGK